MKKILERTLVVIKPYAAQQPEVVEGILKRFKKEKLKVIAQKKFRPSEDLIGEHYPNDDSYNRKVGENCLWPAILLSENTSCWDDLREGQRVRKWNIEYLCSGEVIAMVLEGRNAVSRTRKIVGDTDPSKAEEDSLRKQYSPAWASFANSRQFRVGLKNTLHASSSIEDSKREIRLWFPELL